jgi:hypothetical protein
MAATRREDDGDRTVYRESQRAFLALRLVTEVRPSGLYVRLGPVQGRFRHVPNEEIAAVSVDSYSAADHGGWHWGVRTSLSGDRTAYRLRGDRGVTVRRTDGSELFVGSAEPAELAAAVESVRTGSPEN